MKKDKKNSFNTPEGYFDNFNERLMDKIRQEESKKLESIIPKNDGFGVPQDYFSEVTSNILSKTIKEQGKVIPLKPKRTFYYSAAAIAAVFLLVFGLTWKAEPTNIGFDDLANTELDAYFENNELGLSSYEFAEAVSLNDVEWNDLLDDDLSDDAILDYLDENIEYFNDLNLEEMNYE